MNLLQTTPRNAALAAFVTLTCATARAQADLRPREADAPPPAAAATLDIRLPRLDHPVVLLSTATAKPRHLAGVFGMLQIDLDHVTVIPILRGTDVEAFEGLVHGAALGAPVYCQVLRPETGGFSLSNLRQAGADPELRFRQQDGLAVCQARADRHLAEVAGTSMAEGWLGQPRIAGVTPLYRPGVEGVAYFEFKVDQGGFVITSTGEHDRPITNWSSLGPTRTELLAKQTGDAGASIARIYKIDSLCYVGESSTQQMVARVGNLPMEIRGLPAQLDENLPETADTLVRREWSSWRALKLGYTETYRPLLRQMKERFAEHWQIERPAGPAPLGDWTPWVYYWADGGSSQQPIYNQHTYGNCAVGCGPVAWAMLFGWGDYQAHQGNSRWAARTGLYRTDGGLGSSSAVAPLYLTSGIENVAEELNRHMGTWCIGGSGATWPSRMDDAQAYLSPRTGATCTARGSDVGVNATSYREDARDSIRDRETPAVIGIGFLSHYPLAFGYAWRSKSTLFGTSYERWFYINPGWGSIGYFEWVDAGTFLVGELFN